MSTFENTQDSSNTRRRIRVPDSAQTTGTTSTVAFSIPIPPNTGFFIQVTALTLKSDYSAAQTIIGEGCFRRAGGIYVSKQSFIP